MGAGANIGGAIGGFGTSFANAILEGRRRTDEEKRRAEDRKLKEFGTVFPLIFQEAQDSGDYTRANEIIGEYMPDIAKQAKKKGIDMAHIGPLLRPATPAATAQQSKATDVLSDVALEAGEPAPLPGRPAVSPGTPEPPPDPKSLFIGMPMTTPTQKIQAKTANARRYAQANPDVPLLTAFQMFGLDVPTVSATSAGSIQSVAGEMPDGSPAFAILDRRPQSPTFGKYLDADTQTPLDGFQPRTATASTSLGQMAERAAKELGFASATAAARAGKMADVNAKVRELQEAESLARGTGTGRARIQTELNAPIGPTAAAQYNVPPTTTLAQLSQTNGLRPEQQEEIRSLAQVDELLTEIGEGLPLVFPEVEAGFWGRLQSQFSLGAQTLAADEDLAKLDAAINAALAQVAKLSGQPGSRLSDTDLRLARSTLAELTPKVFRGDTRQTAMARLGVLRRLLDKAKSTVPGRTAAPGAAPAAAVPGPGGTPGAAAAPVPGAGTNAAGGPQGAVIKDGQLYINGVLIQ